ncbi:MAG: methionine ABC transporter ATP-binding protein [Limnochordia bacterium]|nr:ATP-binding cassette domain-containing protein [Bacillota bacterium]NLL07435.1 ATP-binding cassette domain-containing protein [Bacillota bacterium]
MIRLKNVSKTFEGRSEVRALSGIDLTIPAGQIYGIIGQSGAGKSTLLRCINMLERPDSGEVWVGGTLMNSLKPKELRAARRKMGMVFQQFNLLNSRTVFANIAFPLELNKTPKQAVRKRVEQLADLVGLADKLEAYPRQLSGGQKQRVGIARALATEPEVLLCDEPTSALDPETTASVLNLLQTINERLGLTVVLVTHEMAVIQETCHSVAVLDEGTVQEAGPVAEIFTHPKSKAAQRLLQGLLAAKFSLPQPSPDGMFIRLTFLHDRANQPIISKLIRRHEVEVNILSGRIDQMKGSPFGMLLVELRGSSQEKDAALCFLEENQVEVEVLSP